MNSLSLLAELRIRHSASQELLSLGFSFWEKEGIGFRQFKVILSRSGGILQYQLVFQYYLVGLLSHLTQFLCQTSLSHSTFRNVLCYLRG